MRSRYLVHDPNAAHFVTSTTVAWLPVFTTAARCDLLIESLAYCREHKALAIHAFVILDNHLHAILSAPDLTRVVADFKRHTARRRLAQLETERCEWLSMAAALLRGASRGGVSTMAGGLSPAGDH